MNHLIIRHVRVKRLQAPLRVPFRTALGQHDLLENALLEIELAGGIRGYGEAAIATHITGETVPGTIQTLKTISKSVSGKSVADYMGLSRQAEKLTTQNNSALAAFEMAMLDALTQAIRIPLWKWFGPRCGRVQTDMTVVIDSYEKSKKLARSIRARGIKAFKIKIGRDEEEDLERVLLVHQEAKGAQLYLDANQGYSAEQTLKLIKKLKARGIIPALIEQPVPKGDWEGLRKVTRESKLTVVADETVRSIADAHKLIKGEYASAINIKFMKSGILESIELARLAKASGLKLMIGQMMETELATTAAAHFAAGLGGFDFIDLDAPMFLKKKVMTHSYVKLDGNYDLKQIRRGIGTGPV